MASESGKKDQPASQNDTGVKRRGLLRFGTLVTALTGASAISAIGASSAEAGPGDKTPSTAYIPTSEKGTPLGVATLDTTSKILPGQLPDLSATYARRSLVGADPLEYGASSTGDSATAFVAAAAASSVIKLKPGQWYRLNTAVTLPAGTTIIGHGATVQLFTQAALIFNGQSASVGLTINAGNSAGYVGGETAIAIQGPNVIIDSCTFPGNAYRMGITIAIPGGGGGSCDNITINNCSFTNTSYGILKQGGPTATPTTAHNIKITNNRFQGIRRGDAIELNAGADTGALITGNSIDDVTANAAVNAGMGIAVAGLTGYGAAENTMFRRFTIANNIVTNVESEAIHTEVACRFTIVNNHCEQIAAGKINTGIGISTWGARNSAVDNNTVTGFDTGIKDDIGSSSGAYIISTDRSVIRNNQVRDCARGIFSGCSGQGKSTFIQGNTVTNCLVGIEQFGGANYYYTGNVVIDGVTSFKGDLNPSGKSTVNATTRTLQMRDNQAYHIDGSAITNAYTNTAGATITGANNTFTLPS
jgi:hypothetical protein